MEQTTIAAVATPPGKGGLAVIRVSGPEALALMRRVFVPKTPGKAFQPRLMMFGHFADGGRTLDECMAVFLKAPHTYTREDVAEIYLHGGEYVVQEALRALFARGAVPAAPGEFTRRAFLNGRIDLSRADDCCGRGAAPIAGGRIEIHPGGPGGVDPPDGGPGGRH